MFVVALAFAWFPPSPTKIPVQDGQVEMADVSGSGILDGMTFSGAMGQIGEPGDMDDTFVFANGTFVSTECDKRCGYPARPYFVRHIGDKIEFTSESRCLYKDAKIVWRGTVYNGTIKGVSTWTVNRWYWTIEKKFSFEGTLINPADSVTSSQ